MWKRSNISLLNVFYRFGPCWSKYTTGKTKNIVYQKLWNRNDLHLEECQKKILKGSGTRPKTEEGKTLNTTTIVPNWLLKQIDPRMLWLGFQISGASSVVKKNLFTYIFMKPKVGKLLCLLTLTNKAKEIFFF